MRLLFLGKRRPQGRDLIERPYGRFHHLPRLLAARGHTVRCAWLSYTVSDPTVHLFQEDALVTSSSPQAYLNLIRGVTQDWRPDWVIGLSDLWYGILARYLGVRLGARTAIDAYDDYESYIPWALPLHWMWRKALRQANLTIAAGPALAAKMNQDRGLRPSIVVPMAPDPGFRPLDRMESRRSLGLPTHASLIGYCGAAYANRGLDTLFHAVNELQTEDPSIRLVVTGRLGPGVRLPTNAQTLGYLADDLMPLVYNALDVLAVPNLLTSFGRHSHPIKLYEGMACQIPVAAAATPATSWILADHPQSLYEPGNMEQMALRLREGLGLGRVDYGPIPSWEEGAELLNQALQLPKGLHR